MSAQEEVETVVEQAGPAGNGERNVRAALVELLLARDANVLRIVFDSFEETDALLAWRDGTATVSARLLASAALRLAKEVIDAGEVWPDELACAVEIVPRIVCRHRESEHEGGRCAGCRADLGGDYPHDFEEDLQYRPADREVLLGADRQFHLVEDCAIEASDDPRPVASTMHEAISLGYARCHRCVGNWYDGLPRTLRAQPGGRLSFARVLRQRPPAWPADTRPHRLSVRLLVWLRAAVSG